MAAIISLKCWNRPAYLFTSLVKLSSCNNIEEYPLLISCDKTDRNTQEQILHAIVNSGIKEKTQIEVIFQEKQLGCAGNFKYCFEKSFSNNEDWTIHIEDDCLLGKDTLIYFEHAIKLLDKNNLFAACSLHRPIHQTISPNSEDVYKLIVRNWFEPCGGFAMTRQQYERIQEMGGVFGVDYISEKGRTFDCQGEDWLKEVHQSFRLSWAWPFHKYFSEGKKSLYPKISRVLNIGRIGLHLTDTNTHQKLQYNKNWIENYNCLEGVFEDSFEIDNNKYVEAGIEEINSIY